LILLYQSKNLLFATDSTEFQRKYIEHMMELFKAIPTGLRYDETLKASVVKALFELKPAAGMHRETATVAGEVARALNAIELDWRVPLLKPVRLDTVKNATVDFEGIARVTFTDSIEAGEILLTVENDLPALVAGYDPGWPLASYRFEYTGMLNRYANIDIFFGGRVFEGDLSSLRLYQWEGKNYRDITTRVDLPARTIRGRTDRFSPLVIMNAVDGRRKLK